MLIIALIGYALMLIAGIVLPNNMMKFWVITITYMITNFGQYCYYLIMMISVINTVEYNEYKTGNRDEAIITSLRPFITKLASALIILVTTLTYLAFGVTGFTNQISELEQQASLGVLTESEKLAQINGVLSNTTSLQTVGMVVVMSVIPCIMMIISYVLYKKKYILDEDEYTRIVGELNARKESKEA